MSIKKTFATLFPDITEEHIKRFTGKNYRYFFYKWKFAGIFSQWNWSAFSFGPFWFFYHKQYSWGSVLAIAYLLGDFIFTTNPLHFTFIFELMLFPGLFANLIHFARLNRLITQGKRDQLSTEQLHLVLQHNGGTRWQSPALLIGICLLLTLCFPSLFGIHLFKTRVLRAEINSIVYAVFQPDILWREFKLLRKDYQAAYLNGHFDLSIYLNESTLKLSELKHGKDHHYTIALQSELIEFKLKAGNYQDAQQLTQELLELYQIRFGPEHLFVIFMLNNQVSNYLYQGRYDLAKPEANNCLLMLDKYKDNFKHPVILSNVAGIYSNLGVVYQVFCKFEMSAKYHREALRLILKAGNGYTIQAYPYLERLGDFYKDQYDAEQANQYYTQAKEIVEPILGSESPLASSIFLKLGEMHFLKHQYRKAAALTRHAHTINQTYYGYEHTATAQSAQLLGKIYFSQANLQEAEIYLFKSLSIVEKAIGKQNAIYAEYLNQISDLYVFRNNYADAESALLQSIKTATSIYGKNHPKLLLPLEQLVSVYENTKNTVARKIFLQQIHRIMQTSPWQPAEEKLIEDLII
ncbi:tetratricopeptide repeat protein [bacterium]|nr:tetratricopeptide repeat protein [bacterium]